MRIIKLFKNHVLALVCAVALIVISCNADLALPLAALMAFAVITGGIGLARARGLVASK